MAVLPMLTKWPEDLHGVPAGIGAVEVHQRADQVARAHAHDVVLPVGAHLLDEHPRSGVDVDDPAERVDDEHAVRNGLQHQCARDRQDPQQPLMQRPRVQQPRHAEER